MVWNSLSPPHNHNNASFKNHFLRVPLFSSFLCFNIFGNWGGARTFFLILTFPHWSQSCTLTYFPSSDHHPDCQMTLGFLSFNNFEITQKEFFKASVESVRPQSLFYFVPQGISQTWYLSKLLHQQILHNSEIYPKRAHNSWHFRPEIFLLVELEFYPNAGGENKV